MNKNDTGLADQLFFAKEAADYLGISVQRLAKLTKEGKLIPLKKNPSGTIYHIKELQRRKEEQSIFASDSVEIGEKGMFSIDTPTRNEAVNMAVVMNLLHVSEKKACEIIDSMTDGYAFCPMTDHITDWEQKLSIPADDIRKSYEVAVSAFASLRESDVIIRKGDVNYPKLLAETDEAPRFLYLRGNANLLYDTRTVALVGSRAAGEEGRRNTARVARILGQNGIIVVSGLAKGIDASAHKAALENGFPTIAVIGTNLNQYYPSENKDIQLQIERKGLVVSQFSPATKTERWFFPLRDGVMSGLSRATVIMEAGETSGALKQARYALKQKRLVLIPQNVFSIKTITWPERFERKGAIRVKTPSEIIDVLSQYKLFQGNIDANTLQPDLLSCEDELIVAETASEDYGDNKL